MSAASKCNHLPCKNRTSNPTGYCYAHEHLTLAVTPRGQYVPRHANGLELNMKLAKESSQPIPANSLGVLGYPYFTSDDLAAYKYFLQSGDERYRPSSETVMDRYPIVIAERDGDQITGLEVGIYGGQGDELFTFNQALPVDQRSMQLGVDLRAFQAESGAQFAVHNSRKYQAVFIDNGIVASL